VGSGIKEIKTKANKKVELTGGSSAALRGKLGRPGQLTFSVQALRAL
jgi:hypothetical protein